MADLTTASVHREPRTPATLGWSPERIRSAELRANSGYFETATDLCEAMMADDRVSAALDRLYSAVCLPLAFELPGVESEESENDPVCQALDNDWWKALAEDIQRDIVGWSSILGHCWLHVLEWRIDEETGRRIPVVECWHQRNFRFDTGEGRWYARVSTDGTTWVEVPIESGDGRWLLLFRYGSTWRSAMKAPWRGIGRFWLLKHYASVDWPASSERHGQGQTFVEQTKTGTGAVVRGLNHAQRQEVANDIAGLGRAGVMVLPDGYTAKLFVDGANTYKTFVEQIRVADLAITIALTGTNLTTEVAGGSLAAATVHETVDRQKMGGLLGMLSTGLREGLWVFWSLINWGPGAVTPYAQWDTQPPENLDAEAERLDKSSSALQKLVGLSVPVSLSRWCERWGIPLADEGDDEDVIRAPAQSGAAPPPPQARAQVRAEAGPPDPLGEYQSGLEAACCAHASRELAPTLAAVLTAVSKASGYEEARELIQAAYGKVAPATRLAELTEAALVMAQLAGIDTVIREHRED